MAVSCAHYNDRLGCKACSRAPATLGCQTWASKYRKGQGKDYLCTWCGNLKDAAAEAALHDNSDARTVTYTRAQTPTMEEQALQLQLKDGTAEAASSSYMETPHDTERVNTLTDHVFAMEAHILEIEDRLKQLEDYVRGTVPHQ